MFRRKLRRATAGKKEHELLTAVLHRSGGESVLCCSPHERFYTMVTVSAIFLTVPLWNVSYDGSCSISRLLIYRWSGTLSSVSVPILPPIWPDDFELEIEEAKSLREIALDFIPQAATLRLLDEGPKCRQAQRANLLHS